MPWLCKGDQRTDTSDPQVQIQDLNPMKRLPERYRVTHEVAGILSRREEPVLEDQEVLQIAIIDGVGHFGEPILPDPWTCRSWALASWNRHDVRG